MYKILSLKKKISKKSPVNFNFLYTISDNLSIHMFKKRDIFQLFNAKKKYNGILINANICKIAKNKHQKHIAY